MEEQIPTPFVPFGFQIGSDERSSFATSMVYDDYKKEITIVGETYGDYFQPGVKKDSQSRDSDCFVAIQHLRNSTKLSWIRRRQYGTPSSSEFCSDIHQRRNGKYIVVGHSEKGGFLSGAEGDNESSGTPAPMYGMVLNLDDKIDIDGGTVLESSKVQYPVAATSNEDGDEAFVVEIVRDSTRNATNGTSLLNGYQDWSASAYSTPGSELSSFFIRLRRFIVTQSTESSQSGQSNIFAQREKLNADWTIDFHPLSSETAQVATLDFISPFQLLVTGFSKGKGGIFGFPTTKSTGTVASFVAVIDSLTGQMMRTIRIDSAGNDRVMGLCFGSDTSEAYVVGMTSGVLDDKYIAPNQDESSTQTYAFIQKIDVDDMSVLWTRQIGGTINVEDDMDKSRNPAVHGLGCTVTPDDEEVYLAGNLIDSTSLLIPDREPFVSKGGTDFFVTKFNAQDGTLFFARQFGSTGDDSLANRRSLSTDKDGNLIILGNTNGPLFQELSELSNTDIFIMSLGRRLAGHIPFFGTSTTPTVVISSPQYFGPSRQSRYEAFLMILTVLMMLTFAAVMTAKLIRWIRGSDKASKRRYQLGDFATSASISRRKSQSPEGIHESLSSTFSLRDSADSDSLSSDIVSQRAIESSEHPGLGLSSILGRHPELITDLGSITSILGKNRKTPHPTERKDNYRGHHSEPNQNDTVSSAYGEIYDLLSLACERLGIDRTNDAEESKHEPPEQKNGDDVSLDDVWNMYGA